MAGQDPGKTGQDAGALRLYLCGCGPIISEALDLPEMARRLAGEGGVEVGIHPTLCSEQGRQWLEAELAQHRPRGVVVAGCSVREHGQTFMDVCRAAGVNPYTLALANIREHCTWVTSDPQLATAKAEALIRAALLRAVEQVCLEERQVSCRTGALVIGGGVAGMTTAQLLADGGREVVLVERTPALGGRVALLGDVFPSLECSSCLLQELLDAVLYHPRIELLLNTEVEEVLGSEGNFTVTARRRARGVDADLCCGCGTCHSVCPVELDNREFDHGLSRRAAIYIPFVGALPGASVIDQERCLRRTGQSCDACVTACPLGAVNLEAEDEMVKRRVGAVVIATGMEPLADAGDSPPGRVLSAMAMERLMNEAGPTEGKLELPGEAGEPGAVALIHCADTGQKNDEHGSRIWAKNMAKFVHQIHHRIPDCRVYQFVRPYSGALGVGPRQKTTPEMVFISLQGDDRISAVEDLGDHATIHYTQGGQQLCLDVDLAVRSAPLQGAAGNERLASLLRLGLDPRGFFLEEHERLRSFCARRGGILLAGAAQGPRDIQQAASHGAAAAGAVLSALVPGRKLDVDPVVAVVDAQRCGACGTCVMACPYRAVTLDEEDGTARVDEQGCRGCGTCAAGCPFAAVEARHYTDAQLAAEVEALLGVDGVDEGRE